MSDDEGAVAPAEAEPTVAPSSGEADSKWLTHEGPTPGVNYPMKVIYCDVCDGWPLEYTEHHPNYEQAKQWMEKNLTDDMMALYVSEDGAPGAPAAKKAQKRGGRGVIKTKKAQQEIEQRVCLSRAPRGKRKYVTVVTGLSTCGVDLKVASKFFGGKFACGSSVTGEDEIVIQGDVKDDLFDVIPDKWPTIDEDNIEDLGDQKRS